MAKYVIFTPPAHGHLNPTLGAAATLVERGEEVVYVASEQFRTSIEHTGARLVTYPEPTPPDPGAGPGPAMLFQMLARTAAEILPWLPDWLAAEKPDLVLADPFAVWGSREADRQAIAVNMVYPSYVLGAIAPHMFEDERARAFLAGLLETPGYTEFADLFGRVDGNAYDSFRRDDPTGISFMPRAFHPGGDQLDERIAFTGPAIRPRAYDGDFPVERLAGQRTMFISLGTVFNHQVEFFRSCFEAFGGSDWTVVLSHGHRLDPKDLGTPPDNFLLAPSVPQLDVLEHTQLFVTHGGMNSTQEALWNGVPLVVVPQMPEQAMTARRVTELKLGTNLDPTDITADQLADAVRTVADDPSYADRVADMRQLSHEGGGAERAADVLMARARGENAG